MQYLQLLTLFLLACSSSAVRADEDSDTQWTFDRDTAIEEYGKVCQTESMLAADTVVKRQEGMSKKKQIEQTQSNYKASKEAKAIVSSVIEDIYSSPEISWSIYIFYRYESCLVNHIFDSERRPISEVANEVLACQEEWRSDDLENLLPCIDAQLVRNQSKE